MKALIFMLISAIFILDSSFAQQAACDYKTEILINNSEFESKDFSWRIRAIKIEGVPTNITGTAEIQDKNGQILKKYRPWTNESISKQKTSNTYSPNLNTGEYKLVSKINVECNDTNAYNNIDVKIIKIIEHKEIITQNNNQIESMDSKINDSSKNETTIPQTIDKKIENKTSQMRVSSLTTDSKNDPEKYIAAEEDNVIQLRSNNDKKMENEITANAVQKPEIIYESSNEKARNLIVVSLLVLSILLNIVLIWKR